MEVYLTRNPSDIADRINLDGLKGTQGDQQYKIPDDVNLNRFDSVIIYRVPFTARIAAAELS